MMFQKYIEGKKINSYFAIVSKIFLVRRIERDEILSTSFQQCVLSWPTGDIYPWQNHTKAQASPGGLHCWQDAVHSSIGGCKYCLRWKSNLFNTHFPDWELFHDELLFWLHSQMTFSPQIDAYKINAQFSWLSQANPLEMLIYNINIISTYRLVADILILVSKQFVRVIKVQMFYTGVTPIFLKCLILTGMAPRLSWKGKRHEPLTSSSPSSHFASSR